ncbi:MAG: universal stress protein [Spirosomataceae bacterium]
MKTILVPTDLSEVAEYALDVAVDIAKKQNATVILLKKIIFPTLEYTVIDNEFYENKEEFYKYLTQDSKERLQDMIGKPAYQGVKFKFKIFKDNESLASLVTQQKADLIVMGSNGATGWKEWTKGSNAEHVVRESSCPVLVVKAPTGEFRRVVFALDFENTQFIKSSLKLLDKTRLDPHFVFVDNGMKRFDSNILWTQMGKLAMEMGLSTYQFEIFESSTVEKGILDYAKSVEADIIVMFTHGRKGFEHFVYGSVAEDVVNHSEVAVMVGH